MSEQVPQVPQAPQDNNYNYNGYAGGPGKSAPLEAPVKPKQVESSFKLLLLTLLLTVVSVPVSIMMLSTADSKADLRSEAMAEGMILDVDALIAATAILLVVLGIICIAINLLCAMFIRKGYNWARILLTVYAAVTLLSLVTGTNVLGWYGILVLVAATVPLYRKPAPEYFTAMKAYRQSQKLSPAVQTQGHKA